MEQNTVGGRVLWKFFVDIRPIIMEALPKNASRRSKFSLTMQNHISFLRTYVQEIFLSVPDVDLDISRFDDPIFCGALNALLQALETLVKRDFLSISSDHPSENHDSEENAQHHTLRSNFTRLFTVTRVVQDTASLKPGSCIIDFGEFDKQREHDLGAVVRNVKEVRDTLYTFFADPIEDLKANLGNATTLTRDEAKFVRKATHQSNLSQSLFAHLLDAVACAKAHEARLQFSGFIDADNTFQLHLKDCGQQKWNLIKCTCSKTIAHNIGTRHRENLACANLKQLAGSQQIRVAFNQGTLSDDDSYDADMSQSHDGITETTLHDMLTTSDHSSGEAVTYFEDGDRRIVQLLIAFSLVNLDKSNWIKEGLSVKDVSLRASETSSTLKRWMPYLSCSLPSLNAEQDENMAVLSFGLLLMEMEAKEIADPKEEDQEWGSNKTSKDSMLKRILGEWTKVDDEYKNIAAACLYFRELSEKFYDPSLLPEHFRTAAMYRYVVAPLYRLVTSRVNAASQLFGKFPEPMMRRQAPLSRISRPTSGSRLQLLFDGDETVISDPQIIKKADKFMAELSWVAEYVVDLTDESSQETENVRIALIDTGIDREDTHIREAIADQRITECRDFVNGPYAAPDPNDSQDKIGHGTHIAKLVLDTAPLAKLYIAKIADDKSIERTHLHRIAAAIRWATEKEVHMISMSLGLDFIDADINKAIQAAFNANICFFAAASNSGGNQGRAWPANRTQGVVCIHASDGFGNDGLINPTPAPRGDNFTTLGICIPSTWQGHKCRISGTSFATPIAAALVANVLHFGRLEGKLSADEKQILQSYGGVCQLLRHMVEQNTATRGGYDYITPSQFWRKKEVTEIIKLIQECASG
ncbi:hypothetical protein BDV96DRAFT_339008 [Lophiotrema nucula]|uniref:Uncharacterized protein n=1 Tax=Lophiotrema nucula TaxID=690887 RepID=A0A6A5YGI6_9PLEO|nr:hypothetical protein BDV96DRAFT_339008 [Lophiotrema nucula]